MESPFPYYLSCFDDIKQGSSKNVGPKRNFTHYCAKTRRH